MNQKFNDKAELYTRFAILQRDLAAWLAEWLEPAARFRCSHAPEGLSDRIASLRSVDRVTGGERQQHREPEERPPQVALEVGAGNGVFTRYLAGRFPCLTAIDLAPRMVEQGRRLLPDVRWCVADAWCLDDEAVDRLYSASLLQWCQEPVPVLRRWRTHVKKCGRMLHGYYVAPTLVEWQELATEGSPVNWRSPSQWEEFFAEAGWLVLRSESQTRVLRFASALELLGFFHHTGAITPRRTPVGTLRRMLADYDRRFASANGSPGVVATWTFFRVEVLNP